MIDDGLWMMKKDAFFFFLRITTKASTKQIERTETTDHNSKRSSKRATATTTAMMKLNSKNPAGATVVAAAYLAVAAALLLGTTSWSAPSSSLFVGACSYMPRNGVYVENLRFVGGRRKKKKTRLAADVVVHDSKTRERSAPVPTRVGLKNGRVRKAAHPGRTSNAVEPDRAAPKGYDLSVKGKEFALRRPVVVGGNGKSAIVVTFKINDFEPSFGNGYSYFVDEELGRLYLVYDSSKRRMSTRAAVVDVNGGSIVARQGLDGRRYVQLPHDEPLLYAAHKVVALPGIGATCASAHYLSYDESSITMTFTQTLMDDVVLTDRDGPLTLYRANNEISYDDVGDDSPTPTSYSIEAIDLRTGKSTEYELDDEDIGDIIDTSENSGR